MRILIGADMIPCDENCQQFIDGDARALVGDRLLDIINGADYRIFNLEIPLTDVETPMKKSGVGLIAPTSSINGYKALGVDLLGIANNHMLDQGYEGMDSTIKTLDAVGISRVGGGYSVAESREPFFFERDGKKIGVYACVEHEFSWAADYGYGANGFDPLDSLDDIAAAKEKCDFLIVLYHGGKEHYLYPSPRLRKVCRKIAEKGADFVVCQHTHCIGSEEDWQGSKILYGQGNFIFTRKEYSDVFPGWSTGVLVAIDIDNDGVKYEYIPFEMTDTGVAYSDRAEILGGLYSRSLEIKDERAMEKKYAEYAAGMINGRYIKRMVGAETDEEFMRRRGQTIFHYIECEAHYEALHTGLKYFTGFPQFEGTLIKK